MTRMFMYFQNSENSHLEVFFPHEIHKIGAILEYKNLYEDSRPPQGTSDSKYWCYAFCMPGTHSMFQFAKV